MAKENDHKVVRFGNGLGSIPGIIGGIILATVPPFVLLKYGQILGESNLTFLVKGSIIAGGIIILVSAFFGLVMPSHVDNWDHDDHPHKQRDYDPEKK